jgi:flagellar protein FliO/FliZ
MMNFDMSQGLNSLLWFVVILLTIPAALWLLKRTPMGGGKGFGVAVDDGLPRNIGTLALSPQQRIVTVEIGQGNQRQWLLLGVTPNSITTLHSMAPQVLIERRAKPRPAPAFKLVLGKLLNEDAQRGELQQQGRI